MSDLCGAGPWAADFAAKVLAIVLGPRASGTCLQARAASSQPDDFVTIKARIGFGHHGILPAVHFELSVTVVHSP